MSSYFTSLIDTFNSNDSYEIDHIVTTTPATTYPTHRRAGQLVNDNQRCQRHYSAPAELSIYKGWGYKFLIAATIYISSA